MFEIRKGLLKLLLQILNDNNYGREPVCVGKFMKMAGKLQGFPIRAVKKYFFFPKTFFYYLLYFSVNATIGTTQIAEQVNYIFTGN